MKNLISTLLSLILFFSFPFCLFAQEKEVTLEKVVVTATRDAQEISKVPANMTVITREEIERSSAQNTIDLLRSEVGVEVRDLFGTGKTASVDIRGFGEIAPQNVLVLVDGRRVNEIDLSGVDWSQIPLDQIERIEILRGPGTVLYGDNATAGVINIITQKPEKPLSAGAGLIVGSYDLHKETISVSAKQGPFSAILNAGYNATDGFRDNSFLRTKDIGGKTILDLNENITLTFSGNFHKDKQGLPGGLKREEIHILGRRATVRPNDEAETDDGYGALGIKARLWNLGRIEAELSYRDREVKNFIRSFFYEDDRNLKTLGITPRYILERPLWGRPNKLTFGLDFYRSKSEVESPSLPSRSEVKKRSTGLYLLEEFSLLENLILSLGYRHEWVEFNLIQEAPKQEPITFREKVKENEPSWSVGLDYLFHKRSSAFFSVKRSFRFPATDELIAFDFSTYPITKVGVNPVNPQTGYHYEGGIRHTFTDQIEANLTLFWIDLKDEIFFNPETGANENYPKTRRQGIEVGTTVRPFHWIALRGNYSYIRPNLRGGLFSGNEIPAVPRHKGSIGADLDFGKGFFFTTRTNIVGSRHFISDFANRIGRLDGYYSVDAKLSYQWKGLKAFIGVNNIFDRKYVEFATFAVPNLFNPLGTRSFFPSPERNYFAGISYTF